MLAVIAALLFAPRVIERTDTTCDAVSAQVVDMMMKQITEAEMAKMISAVPGNPPQDVAREFVLATMRRSLAGKMAPKLELSDKSWYQCSALYWVNFVNPPPRRSGE